MTCSSGTASLGALPRGLDVVVRRFSDARRAPESATRLFERYYRTPGGKTRASDLGLGLYIACLIVDAHGGRIDVSSKVGEGSTFSLILPSQGRPRKQPLGRA